MKLACDFTFDDNVYIIAATLDAGYHVVGLEALGNVGKPRASDVHEQCALIGVLLTSGIPFDYFEHAQKLGPLTMSIIAGCVRARDAAIASLRSAQLLEGARP